MKKVFELRANEAVFLLLSVLVDVTFNDRSLPTQRRTKETTTRTPPTKKMPPKKQEPIILSDSDSDTSSSASDRSNRRARHEDRCAKRIARQLLGPPDAPRLSDELCETIGQNLDGPKPGADAAPLGREVQKLYKDLGQSATAEHLADHRLLGALLRHFQAKKPTPAENRLAEEARTKLSRPTAARLAAITSLILSATPAQRASDQECVLLVSLIDETARAIERSTAEANNNPHIALQKAVLRRLQQQRRPATVPQPAPDRNRAKASASRQRPGSSSVAAAHAGKPGKCFNCGSVGHVSASCPAPQTAKSKEAAARRLAAMKARHQPGN